LPAEEVVSARKELAGVVLEGILNWQPTKTIQHTEPISSYGR